MYLITGGTGFIGHHLIDTIINDNDMDVVILSSHSQKQLSNITNPKIKIEKGNIIKFQDINDLFNKYDIEGVYHMAALSDIRYSFKFPIETHNINVNGTLNLLESMRIHDVNRIVFSSSSAVYGNTQRIPIDESEITTPISVYGFTKVACENYCKMYSELYGMKNIILRYFNVYGSGMDVFSPASVILLFLNKISKGETPTIFGDGNQTRDFVFVNDVVQANIMAMLSSRTGVYNIGSGTPTSLNQLVKIIIDITGHKLNANYVEPRLGDIYNSVANISKAKKELEFCPKYSILDGISELYNQIFK